MSPRTAPPVVLIPCDHRVVALHPFHMVGEKYVNAVRNAAGALPLLVPVLDPPLDLDELLDQADGVLLTGSPSNVAPAHYGGPPARPETLLDPRRDATTLAFIRRALARERPLLAICRGFQELNVAFGGTLHQHLAEVPGRFDHREAKDAPLDVQYAPAHTVSIMPGGQLARILGASAIEVNSLHAQGVDRLAGGLVPEAVAGDGTIEAFRVRDTRGFALGVQWHPEWKVLDNPPGRALFGAFGAALRQSQAERRKRS